MRLILAVSVVSLLSACCPSPSELLAIDDLDRHALRGKWRMDGSVLVSPKDVRGKQAKIAFPCEIPEEYDLEAIVTRRDGTGAFYFGIMAYERRVLVHLDSHTSSLVAIDPIEGSTFAANPTRRVRNVPVLPTDVPVRMKCEVRKGGVRVLADRTVILDWVGDLKKLGTKDPWWTEGCVAIATWETRFEIEAFRMIPR